MPSITSSNMDSPIPFLKCRGSYFEVGLQIGTHFKDMIQDLLQNWAYFKSVILKAGETPEGQYLMQQSLNLCRKKFPQYVIELEGMAEGAEIEFDKLFMLNVDSILETLEPDVDSNEAKMGITGCTSILCNQDEIILGHTEDTLKELEKHVYIISAEIITEGDGPPEVLEKFTTLCYAGSLMGYTMGFNSHGMIYSVNTIFPTVNTSGTPRSFLSRALLGVTNLKSLVKLLKDEGNGISDGLSLNVCFKNREFFNIEVGPPQTGASAGSSPAKLESLVDIMKIEAGTTYVHCNRYLRINNASEQKKDALVFSDRRMSTIQKYQTKCEENVKDILSDQSDYNYPIYNDGNGDNDNYEMNFIRTVAVGVFNVLEKTWNVYASPPNTGSPVHSFNLDF